MEMILNDLAYILSEQDCNRFDKTFDDVKQSAVINKEEKQRILSRIMEKVTHDSKEIIVERERVIPMD